MPIEFTVKVSRQGKKSGILVAHTVSDMGNPQYMNYKGRNFLLAIISWSGLSLTYKMFLTVWRQESSESDYVLKVSDSGI